MHYIVLQVDGIAEHNAQSNEVELTKITLEAT